MSEKRFTIDKIFKEYPKLRDNETECFYHLVDNERNAEIFCERLNNLVEENEQLKEECDALQKKTEMDKNDFFISEAKRMRLLAFIQDNELQKEYSEWERRIWDE